MIEQAIVRVLGIACVVIAVTEYRRRRIARAWRGDPGVIKRAAILIAGLLS